MVSGFGFQGLIAFVGVVVVIYGLSMIPKIINFLKGNYRNQKD